MTGLNAPHNTPRRKQEICAKLLKGNWRPRRDSSPCYRRESPWVNRNCNKTHVQEAIGTHPLRSRKQAKGPPETNFHRYAVRALRCDFRRVLDVLPLSAVIPI